MIVFVHYSGIDEKPNTVVEGYREGNKCLSKQFNEKFQKDFPSAQNANVYLPKVGI